MATRAVSAAPARRAACGDGFAGVPAGRTLSLAGVGLATTAVVRAARGRWTVLLSFGIRRAGGNRRSPSMRKVQRTPDPVHEPMTTPTIARAPCSG